MAEAPIRSVRVTPDLIYFSAHGRTLVARWNGREQRFEVAEELQLFHAKNERELAHSVAFELADGLAAFKCSHGKLADQYCEACADSRAHERGGVRR